MDLSPRAFYLGHMDELEEILSHNNGNKENICKSSQATPSLNMSSDESSSCKPSQATPFLNMFSNELSSCMFKTRKEHSSMEIIAFQAIDNLFATELQVQRGKGGPNQSRSIFGVFKYPKGEAIREHIGLEYVAAQVFYGEAITTTVHVATLLEIFSRAGDGLNQYYESTYNPELEPLETIIEVARILQHAGIRVLFIDVELTDIYSDRIHPDMLKSIHERLGVNVYDTIQNAPFSSARRNTERDRPRIGVLKNPMVLRQRIPPKTAEILHTAKSVMQRSRARLRALKHPMRDLTLSLEEMITEGMTPYLAYAAVKLRGHSTGVSCF